MSSYNNIEKIKYSSEDCVVNLQEYIIFENERAEEKFVVFKFTNNVNQQLLGLEFEVSQYDAENNLVEKSVALYNKFLAKPCQPFVPNAKLKVNYACKTLSVRLIQASFDRFIWKEGQFLDNSYKFEHYAQDEDTEAAKRNPARPVKVKAQKPDPAPKKRKGKLPFKAKNATRKNIARFPAIFNAFVCLVVVCAILFAVFHFNKTSEAFTIDNFDVRITSKEDKTVTVIGYSGEADVTVPAKIQDYTVTRIGENAFKNTEIKSIKFNSTKLYIESRAFSGCESLKTVTSSAEMTVHGYAFENCTALRTVSLPGATLLKNSFAGCTGVTSLEYGSLGADTLEDVFGGKLPKNLTVVEDEKKPDDDKKPDDGDEEKFVYDPDKTYAYGDLDGKGVEGYARYYDYETVGGTIITVNPNSIALIINTEIKGISEKVYDDLDVFTSLTINGDFRITQEIANKFSSITLLDISNHVSVDESLQLFNKLQTLSIPYYDAEATLTEQYSVPGYLETLILKPSDTCNVIPNNAFAGVNVREIVVEEGFTCCGTNIVSNNNNIEKITLPKGIDCGEGVIGINCINLTTVDVYFSNFDISYSQFNYSYEYTLNLTVSCSTLDGRGFLTDAHTYLNSLTLYANKATVRLGDFINESTEPYHISLAIAIGDKPDDFYEVDY